MLWKWKGWQLDEMDQVVGWTSQWVVTEGQLLPRPALFQFIDRRLPEECGRHGGPLHRPGPRARDVPHVPPSPCEGCPVPLPRRMPRVSPEESGLQRRSGNYGEIEAANDEEEDDDGVREQGMQLRRFSAEERSNEAWRRILWHQQQQQQPKRWMSKGNISDGCL